MHRIWSILTPPHFCNWHIISDALPCAVRLLCVEMKENLQNNVQMPHILHLQIEAHDT